MVLESQGLTLGPVTLLLDDGALDVLLDMSSSMMAHFPSGGFGDGVMASVCPSNGGTLVLVQRHGEICMIWTEDGLCDGEREELAPTASLGLGISPMMRYLVLAWQCQPTHDDDDNASMTSTIVSVRVDVTATCPT